MNKFRMGEVQFRMDFLFRPHHFLCALNFKGEGHSKEFVDHFKDIMMHLEERPETRIKVVQYNDDICAHCPHNASKVVCRKGSIVEAFDTRHARVLEISINDELTWFEAKQRIHKKVSISDFHKMCKNCPWKPLGICEASLTDFLMSHNGKTDFS